MNLKKTGSYRTMKTLPPCSLQKVTTPAKIPTHILQTRLIYMPNFSTQEYTAQVKLGFRITNKMYFRGIRSLFYTNAKSKSEVNI